MATPIPTNEAPFTTEELVRITRGHLVAGGAPELLFRGVAIDSRAVRSGNVFVALRGASHDGHDFVEAAVAAGAGAVIVERPVQAQGAAVVVVPDSLAALGELGRAHRARFPIPVVAITGSVGKTTTKDLVAEALSALGLRVHRSAGNLNNLVGAPMSVLGIGSDHDAAVLELGMNVPGEIARLTALVAPTIGLVTAVSEVHLAGVGSLAGVAAEKGALLLGLGPDATAIATADDALLDPYVERCRARAKLRFGVSEHADVRLAAARLEAGRSRAQVLVSGGPPVDLELQLLGEGPLRSATAALAVVLALRGPDALPPAARALGAVSPGEGRARSLPGLSGSTILDDAYNASPRTIDLALRSVAALAGPGGRAIAVLGDMKELGAEAERLHEAVGAAAVQAGVAILVCCGPEMRAAARGALASAAAGQARGVRIESVDDPADAIALLRPELGPGDVVLVKGSRSMKMERVVRALAEETP